MQCAQFLLGAPRALEQVSQVAGHARALVRVAQKPAINERLLEMVEEPQELGFGRGAAMAAMHGFGRRFGPLGHMSEELVIAHMAEHLLIADIASRKAASSASEASRGVERRVSSVPRPMRQITWR